MFVINLCFIFIWATKRVCDNTHRAGLWQSDMNQSLHASPPFHFWRNVIKIKFNPIPVFDFLLNHLCTKRQRLSEDVRTNSSPETPWTDGDLKGQMRERAGEWLWHSYYNGHITDINYSFTITYPLSFPLSSFSSSCSLLQWDDRAAARRWNVSPHWAWHLQITAHYLGVTCPVPVKYHREGRMCVCACCYAQGALRTISHLIFNRKLQKEQFT